MPVKTPIYLKTPSDRRGRKLRLRDFLSGDMISPPLGDVRHSAHVGPRGPDDMFGDVSFLKGQMDIIPALKGAPNGHRSSTHAPNSGGPSAQPPSSTDPTAQPLSAQRDPYPSVRAPQHRFEETIQALSLHQDTATSLTSVQNKLCGSKEKHWPLNLNQDTLPSLRGARSSPCPLPPHTPSSDLDPSSFSLDLLMAVEQAPPKPPRLHLDPPPHLSPAQSALTTPPRVSPSPCDTFSHSLGETIQRLCPSSMSSSEDSLFDCGPPGAPRGLSLDSDVGLSNEEGGSEGSLRSNEGSPTSPQPTDFNMIQSNMIQSMVSDCPLTPSISVMTSLDLDLGPSIMDDVLSIMDRYGAPH